MIYLLSHIIDQSADAFPAKPAFRYYQETVTYAELSRRTNQLAAILKDQGIRRGDRIGIYMNKCLYMPIAVHGILKAGAAYVPIDPAAPPNRLRLLIQHCAIRVLITQQSKAGILSQVLDETELECLIGMDEGTMPAVRIVSWSEVFQAPIQAPPVGAMTEMDLAYIMYTSGSTGVPKGIMHTHHSGLSYAKLSAATFELDHRDILGNHSPLHFDMSTFEFLAGPLKGACSVLVPEEYTKLPASLSNLMESEQMTIWYSVTFALIQLFLRGALENRDLSALRWIMFAGEPFPAKYLRAWMKRLPQARFSNVYGPAEVNQCTYYHVPHPPEENDNPVPIGRVWANSEGMVIDKNDRPVPPGQKGELVIRTPTMMQGYWHQEDLNRQAFYHRSPFPGFTETYYRTGDLVTEGADGNYRYHGRKDRQIKTRGYRVELDEIEIALTSHDHVEESAAFPVPDEEGSLLIFAGVTLKDPQAVSAPELMKHIKDKLPWYALPQKIRIMSAFPRTATGKIDRNILKEAAISAR